MKISSVTCPSCEVTEEYEDDGKTFDCMPDGYMVGLEWYCVDCYTCNMCGEELKNARASPSTYSLCDDCEGGVNVVVHEMRMMEAEQAARRWGIRNEV